MLDWKRTHAQAHARDRATARAHTNICNNYFFSTATVVSRTRLNVTLYVPCLSCYSCPLLRLAVYVHTQCVSSSICLLYETLIFVSNVCVLGRYWTLYSVTENFFGNIYCTFQFLFCLQSRPWTLCALESCKIVRSVKKSLFMSDIRWKYQNRVIRKGNKSLC